MDGSTKTRMMRGIDHAVEEIVGSAGALDESIAEQSYRAALAFIDDMEDELRVLRTILLKVLDN